MLYIKGYDGSIVDSSIYSKSVSNTGVTLSGTQSACPDYLQSMYFNGSSTFLNTPASQDLNFGTGNFFIGFWVYGADQGPSYPAVISNGNSGSWTSNDVNITFDHAWSAGKIGFAVNNYSGSGGLLTGTTTVTNSAWHYVVISRNGNSFYLYVDGNLDNSNTWTGAIDFSLGGTYIGKNTWDGGNGYFAGYINDVKMVKGSSLGYNGSAMSNPVCPDYLSSSSSSSSSTSSIILSRSSYSNSSSSSTSSIILSRSSESSSSVIPVLGITIQAEDATLGGGVGFATNHVGYTGTGFLDGFYGSTSVFVIFTLSIPTSGYYIIGVRCAMSGSGSLDYYINGSYTGAIEMVNTGWDSWALNNKLMYFPSGSNTVKYMTTPGRNGPNIDRLDY